MARCWHACIAALVLLALVVQVVIALRAPGTPHSAVTGLLRGSSAAGRIVRVASFFTIQSNILSGVVSAQLARRPDRDGRGWNAVRLAALIGITVTGVVYSAVLADIHEPNGSAELLVNSIVHYLVPVLMVAGWLLFGPRPRIDGATVLRAVAFPVLWTLYTLVRGAIWHWYPYPFVDVGAHGYAVVAVNGVVVAALFALIAVGLRAADSRLRPAP